MTEELSRTGTRKAGRLSAVWKQGICFCQIFICSGFLFPLQAQVKDVPVEKQIAKESIPVERFGQSRVFTHRIDPMVRRAVLETKRFRVIPNPLLSRRVYVEVSDVFVEEKMELMKKTFRSFEGNEKTLTILYEDKRWGVADHHMKFGTSRFDAQKGQWQVHLQRVDFEKMAETLSLNDLNRFQFRRNRNHGNDLPKTPAAGNTQ